MSKNSPHPSVELVNRSTGESYPAHYIGTNEFGDYVYSTPSNLIFDVVGWNAEEYWYNEDGNLVIDRLRFDSDTDI